MFAQDEDKKAKKKPAAPAKAPAKPPAVVVQPKAAAPAQAPAKPAGPAPAHDQGSPFHDMFSDTPANHYKVEGQKESKKGEGFFGKSEYQHWDAVGKGSGNREGDTPQAKDKNDPKSEKEVANAKQGAPDVAQANLDDVPETERSTAGKVKNGAYRDERFGVSETKKELALKGKHSGEGNEGEIGSIEKAAGMREKVGVKGEVSKEGKYGKAAASGDAYAVGELGASGKLAAGSKGLDASAAASGKLGVGATGDADVTSKGLEIKGVEKPLDAGAGVHGEVFAGTKAGAAANAHLGPDGFNLSGKAGAFAGGEAAADAHAHLGPLAGKFGVSGMAGAGAGIEGGISMKDWKLTMGGKMYASVGYGGSMGGEVSVDFKQAGQLAAAGAKKAYDMADADGDGRLTLNDPATMGAKGMKGAAGLIDKGTDKVLGGLQKGKELIDKARHITPGDIQHGVKEAKDFVGNKLEKAEDYAKEKAGEAKDWAADRVKDAKGFLDKASKITPKDVKEYLGEAGHKVVEGGKKLASDIGEKAHQAKDYVADKAGQAKDWTVETAKAGLHKMEDAGTALKDKAKATVQEVHDLLDVNHDGKIDAKDLVAAGGKAAHAAKQKAVETFHKTVEAGQHAYEAAKQKAADLGHKATEAVKAAPGYAKKKAGQAADWAKGKAAAAGHWAKEKAGQAKEAILHAPETIKEKAGQAKEWVKDEAHNMAEGAKAAYHEAKDQVSQAAHTLSEGFHDAKETLKGTWGKVTHFFGG